MKILLILSIAFCLNVSASEYNPYTKFEIFLDSDSVPIKSALNDWHGDKYTNNGTRQKVSLWMESGVNYSDWGISALYREDSNLKYNSDTADFFYGVQNDALDENRLYDINLEISRFRGQGVRLFHDFSNNDIKVRVGTSILHASKILEAFLTGRASSVSAQNYDVDTFLDYLYYKDSVFERPNIDTPSGVGVFVDLQVDWSVNNRLNISTKVKDLYSAISWDKVPYTQASIVSDNQSIDSDGHTSINPVMSGVEGYKDSYSNKLDYIANLDFDYAISPGEYSALVRVKKSKERVLIGLGINKHLDNDSVSLVAWPDIGSLELAYESNDFEISINLDDIYLPDSNNIWLSISYDW
jgi:hypothetical protein